MNIRKGVTINLTTYKGSIMPKYMVIRTYIDNTQSDNTIDQIGRVGSRGIVNTRK